MQTEHSRATHNHGKGKPVRKYDEEEKGGDGGDEEESPEKPAVNSLRKHFPLSTDVVVPRLNNQPVDIILLLF